MKKNLSILFSIIILSAVIGLGVRFVFAQIGWYEPTDAPPIDNEIPLWIRVGNDMYHTTGGNVGIGTTSPASKLEVVNSSSASDVYGIKTAASSSYGGYERIYGIYSSATASPTSGGDTTIGVYGLASSTRGSPIGVYGAGGTRGQGVYGSGKVGVYGYAYGIAGGTGVIGLGGYYGVEAIGQNVGLYADGADYGIYSASGKHYFGGNVGIGTTSPGADVGMTGGLTINGTNWTQMTVQKNGVNGFALNTSQTTSGDWTMYDRVGGTWNSSITSRSGNVGIGTTDPKEKLVVKNGNAYISGRDNGLILRDPNGQCRKITVDSAGALKVSSAFTCPDVTYLVNGQHDTDACSSAGGTVVDSGGNLFCKFGGSSCPSGWSQYNSWSTTTAATCNGKNSSGCSGATSCTTGSHTFSDAGRETCDYKDRAFRVYRCRDFGQTCGANITEVGCY